MYRTMAVGNEGMVLQFCPTNVEPYLWDSIFYGGTPYFENLTQHKFNSMTDNGAFCTLKLFASPILNDDVGPA